ncbi:MULTISPECIES: biotin transporter BioY [unclassified Bosea (in: a-proteobacteria)]|uniref:biotin transporter BioY n=1 Tax=unclassified Bosea (in: a-proteobacteria) TaxID=2653178 RepID=UPI000F74FFE7|nr:MULTISPECIES: biotin transporter BioY [unclassified Bosea (in: a-proteobacteria)]AZO80868.1 BioY family transporter [Bosea sp. Tri-49]RXT25834.1 BioY family transporter [Bosea sp. Tri-39]RXT31076.1 BioY family transporter [Bosea sp. Tri-54]
MPSTLIEARAVRFTSIARHAPVVIAGVGLMVLAAKTQIPFWPVPMTLHTLAVMAFAVALGPQRAVSIVAAYLAVGAAGFPVFSGSPERGIGLAYLVGPTGGYLAGYLAASWLVGTLARGRGVPGQLFAMLVGLVLVYAVGLAWLALFVPASQLTAVGLWPFLLGDLLKLCVVAAGSALLPIVLSGPSAWWRR